MQARHITLAHGNGGRFMRELIDEVFARHLGSPDLHTDLDAAAIELPPGQPLFTTDGFIVKPLEFPGGDIGSLCVHGTCNDIAVAGGDPLYLTLNAFIEEGMGLEQLERLVKSIGKAARETGVQVVAGDTKVLPHGEGSGVYFATSGVGVRPTSVQLGMAQIQPSDRVLVSGPVGDHGVCVMLAREEFGMRGDLRSDAADVLPLTRAIRELPGLRFMRDPTRGGLATVGHEIARATGLTVRLSDPDIPVRDPVNSVCEMLGYDPLFLACEGRVVAVASAQDAATILAAWQALPQGRMARDIGSVEAGRARLEIETELGGRRILEELQDDPLPRIC
jgi:hydrogenase expression/formation protein HypE